MNIKTSILTHIFALIVGALLWAKFQPKPSPNQPETSQAQIQDCQVIVKKVVGKDGTISETTEIKASQKQEQVIIPNVNKNALLLGIATDKKVGLNIILDKWSHEIRTDLNKDHVYQLNYKVLEF